VAGTKLPFNRPCCNKSAIHSQSAGQDDPQQLAQLARGQLKKKIPQLQLAIKQYYKAVYSERVTVVRKLIERFDVGPFGDALFGGNVKSLQPLLDAYGSEGMKQIRTLTTGNNSKKAIEYIDNHRGR